MDVWKKFAVKLGCTDTVEAWGPRLRHLGRLVVVWHARLPVGLKDTLPFEKVSLVVLPALDLTVGILETRHVWVVVVLVGRRRSAISVLVLVDVHEVMPGKLSELCHLQVVLAEQFLHEVASVVETAITLLRRFWMEHLLSKFHFGLRGRVVALAARPRREHSFLIVMILNIDSRLHVVILLLDRRCLLGEGSGGRRLVLVLIVLTLEDDVGKVQLVGPALVMHPCRLLEASADGLVEELAVLLVSPAVFKVREGEVSAARLVKVLGGAVCLVGQGIEVVLAAWALAHADRCMLITAAKCPLAQHIVLAFSTSLEIAHAAAVHGAFLGLADIVLPIQDAVLLA